MGMASSLNIQSILNATRKAGELLKKLSLDPEMRKAQLKADGSPVTKADQHVSDFLVQSLQPLGHMVISEEGLPAEPPTPDQSYFLIDPLDGTKYFSQGEDEYAICVGFLQAGAPYFGAIYDPIHSRLFWAERGRGAFCDDTPIRHSGVTGDLRVFSSGFHKRPERKKITEALQIGEILEKGSALKFCDIAMGEADLYMRFGPTSEWDTAAAQVLLEEAGCSLFEVKTQDVMQYGKPDYLNRGIIAGHQSQMQPVIELLQRMGPPKLK
jgi:3'(2'), 5'-bisphosphate nucleotidase